MKKHFLSIVAVAAVLASCNDLKKPETKDQLSEATADTAVVARTGETAADATSDAGAKTAAAVTDAGGVVAEAWDVTKEKLSNVKLPEINLPDIDVRGSENYNVYGLEEKVLFDTDKAELKPTATKALQQVAASIAQRYGKNQVRIMGFADSRGDKDYNKELSEKRADAVKNWFVQNGKVDASRISVEPMGEAQPAASNATASGRQQNRRVEIAVRTK
ncbi:OmpA family protein [Hymenobacter sp. GOD-10R]|uniref:OmpA family protein n=1 Tax=Hymenobacter sp. GOD-10R TaxID=3093922 RepID=UPI002D76E50A|nr:OmpA family protein [Hymenobacter sp. GOD-10R]WRQ27867.1 OmpA family protein [Hymenobacter sp. GOD-10R]